MRFGFARTAETLVVALSLLSSFPALAQVPVNLEDVDPLKDCKRREVQLIESGNKVYMYGGQIWLKNGTQRPYQVTNHFLRIVDFTTARDMNDRSILSVKDIPGTVTIFQYGAFWVDSKRVYIVGGSVNDEAWLARDGQFYPSNYTGFKGGSVFTYDIDADKWASETAVQPTEGNTVTDSFCCGSFAYNAVSRKAFYFSGTNGAGARRSLPNATPIYVGVTNEQLFGNSNLLTFDTAAFKWKNVTVNKQLTTTGTINGQFVFLPGTQRSNGGIGVHIGGRRRDTDQLETFRQVLVYDSANDTWYNQATTVDGGGNFPAGRVGFCAVATSAADNSSHNIYMYGGESETNTNSAFSDMWILSIPSFRWIRVNVDLPARKSHGCTLVAQKYMLTYGGVPSGWGSEGDGDECDQDNYGMRLFDMSNLGWTGRYDGPPQTGKNAYTVPKVVIGAIGGNEQGGATQTAPIAGFETPSMSSLFQRSSPTSSGPATTSSGSSAVGGGAAGEPAKKKSNVGAIAGGVLGGLAAIIIILIGVLLLLRRKKKQKQSEAEQAYPPIPLCEADGRDAHTGELPGAINGQQGKWAAHEIYGRENLPPQEMYAGNVNRPEIKQQGLMGQREK
ncbi:hypothetical protein B0J11DRAFT_526029 [Dendryphion nanum]|uniref:Kelch repeat-containing protein n=1 Tax=Dendryphion nanum TaxID=256645 RepID=A0A9P9IN28_9PLEO|nr:hypothetical protein B0J11DRAFT_526029 [Dendryphion nanum]